MVWRKYTLATCLVLFSSNSVQAAEWKYLVTGSDDSIYFVDVQSVRELPPIQIRRPFTVRTLWVQSNHQFDKSVKFRKKVSLYYFDCESEKVSILSDTTYSPNGRVLESSSYEDYDFYYKPQAPDTIGYALMEFACGRRSVPVP